MNSNHAFNMVKQDLVDSIDNANKDTEEKTADKEAKKEQIAENKKELASTIQVKTEDENLRKNLDVECEEKTLSFQKNQKLRTEQSTTPPNPTMKASTGKSVSTCSQRSSVCTAKTSICWLRSWQRIFLSR